MQLGQQVAGAMQAAEDEAMQALAGVVQAVQQRGQQAVWRDALAAGPASLEENLPASDKQQVGASWRPPLRSRTDRTHGTGATRAAVATGPRHVQAVQDAADGMPEDLMVGLEGLAHLDLADLIAVDGGDGPSDDDDGDDGGVSDGGDGQAWLSEGGDDALFGDGGRGSGELSVALEVRISQVHEDDANRVQTASSSSAAADAADAKGSFGAVTRRRLLMEVEPTRAVVADFTGHEADQTHGDSAGAATAGQMRLTDALGMGPAAAAEHVGLPAGLVCLL